MFEKKHNLKFLYENFSILTKSFKQNIAVTYLYFLRYRKVNIQAVAILLILKK